MQDSSKVLLHKQISYAFILFGRINGNLGSPKTGNYYLGYYNAFTPKFGAHQTEKDTYLHTRKRMELNNLWPLVANLESSL